MDNRLLCLTLRNDDPELFLNEEHDLEPTGPHSFGRDSASAIYLPCAETSSRVMGRFLWRDPAWWIVNPALGNKPILVTGEASGRIVWRTELHEGGAIPLPHGCGNIHPWNEEGYRLEWSFDHQGQQADIDVVASTPARRVDSLGTVPVGMLGETATEYLAIACFLSERRGAQFGILSNQEVSRVLELHAGGEGKHVQPGTVNKQILRSIGPLGERLGVSLDWSADKTRVIDHLRRARLLKDSDLDAVEPLFAGVRSPAHLTRLLQGEPPAGL